MLILQSLLVIVQGVIAVAMIALILLQHGRGADAGASFGSGSSSTVFGSRGAGNFLSRSTAVLAALFMINCLTLAYLARQQAESGGIMQNIETAADPTQEGVGTASEVPSLSDDGILDAAPALELPAIPALEESAAEDAGAETHATVQDTSAPAEAAGDEAESPR